MFLTPLLAGCNPSYAPPIRSTLDVAAGRVPAGGWRASASLDTPLSGSGEVGIPLGHSPLHLEAGGHLGGIANDDTFAMGFAGLRYTVSGREHGARSPGTGPALDVEAGGGIGVGGRNATEEPERPSTERLAGGGYTGLGLAYHFNGWLAAAARGRLQLTTAEGAPTTMWMSAVAGPDFGIGPFHIASGVGVAGYNSGVDSSSSWIGETTLGVIF